MTTSKFTHFSLSVPSNVSAICTCVRCSRHLRGTLAAALGGEGGCGPCPDFASYTLAFALQLRKIKENLSQGNRKVLGCSASNAIRLVELVIAGDGLHWPAGSCRPWLTRQATGSTLGQRKYLPSCRKRGFPKLYFPPCTLSYVKLC
jgi:hypothetical protein